MGLRDEIRSAEYRSADRLQPGDQVLRGYATPDGTVEWVEYIDGWYVIDIVGVSHGIFCQPWDLWRVA